MTTDHYSLKEMDSGFILLGLVIGIAAYSPTHSFGWCLAAVFGFGTIAYRNEFRKTTLAEKELRDALRDSKQDTNQTK